MNTQLGLILLESTLSTFGYAIVAGFFVGVVIFIILQDWY